jgi:hypothetical protein
MGFKTLEEIRKRQTLSKYPGNAPPMRAIPIAFIKNFEEVK